MNGKIREAIMFHEQEIERHSKEIVRLIHDPYKLGRCECCGGVFDADDNSFGFCSDDCANSYAD